MTMQKTLRCKLGCFLIIFNKKKPVEVNQRGSLLKSYVIYSSINKFKCTVILSRVALL